MILFPQRIDKLNEYLPLKQGLRLIIARASLKRPDLNEYLPLKQGLRPLVTFATVCW